MDGTALGLLERKHGGNGDYRLEGVSVSAAVCRPQLSSLQDTLADACTYGIYTGVSPTPILLLHRSLYIIIVPKSDVYRI